MNRYDKQLTAQLIELRKAIKRKYKQLKEGSVEDEIMLEKQYKPIIRELRKPGIADGIKTEIKQEPKEEEEEEEKMEGDWYESDNEQFIPETVSTPKPSDDLSSTSSTTLSRETASQYVDRHYTAPLTKMYMTGLAKDSAKHPEFDQYFGPRLLDTGAMLGDTPLQFDDDGGITIKNTRYKPTKGLYELLFKINPDKKLYTNNDLKAYKTMLATTNAIRKDYNPNERIKSTSSTKYKKLIKNLFQTPSGRGMSWKKVESRDIVHWDDANELVDRLKHIVMSHESGNRVHSNEIINILAELREAGFIKGGGNSRLKSLLQ